MYIRRRTHKYVMRDGQVTIGMTAVCAFLFTPIITVVGKAFWDIGHAPKDQSNRRKYMPGYAAWEIHPVMKLDVKND